MAVAPVADQCTCIPPILVGLFSSPFGVRGLLRGCLTDARSTLYPFVWSLIDD